MRRQTYTPRRLQRQLRFWLLVVGLAVFSYLLLRNTPFAAASEPVEAGYRDFSYHVPNNKCTGRPTAEKPESKLWLNDGIWWGSLCNDADKAFHIYRFDLASQSWTDTGTVIDDRPRSKADTLWDGQYLYVASHAITSNALPSTSTRHWGRLYRYSYDAATQTYSLDPGFPVYVTRGKSETLTIAKDSAGQLWVTYVESQQVMINYSLTSDLDWGEPVVLPVTGATNLTTDDISAIIAFNGRVGVMWSNQNDMKMRFAVHTDGTPATDWQSSVIHAPSGKGVDDHINLKYSNNNGTDELFAVIKTGYTHSTDPQIVLLACTSGDCALPGNWQAYTVSQVVDEQTRPIVLLDTEHRQLHVFARGPASKTADSWAIFHKSTAMDSIQFPPGQGTLFIRSSADVKINDATSTRQNLDSTTGLLVAASDKDTEYYFHNYLDLSLGTSTATPTPTSTPVTTQTATVTPTPTATPTPANDHDIIYVSSSTSGTAGGVSFKDEDILAYNTVTGTWSLYFDGSDVGVNSTDLNAFEMLNDGSILMSFSASSLSIPGFDTVEDSDIVRFIPTSLGTDTAGSFEWYFDGSDVGLTTSDEDIDVIGFAPDGRLLISTTTSFIVDNLAGKDEDLIVFTAAELGSNTRGSWSMYFDGSDVGLSSASSEDVGGAWIDTNTGEIYLTTKGNFSVQGSNGDGADIFVCAPVTLGDATSCVFGPGLFWDGSGNGFGGEIMDGMNIQFASP